MKKNNIPVLDFYFDKLNMLLWPRFKDSCDVFVLNIKGANPRSFRLYGQAGGAHFTTQRYVDFVAGLYKIANSFSQNMLLIRLG